MRGERGKKNFYVYDTPGKIVRSGSVSLPRGRSARVLLPRGISASISLVAASEQDAATHEYLFLMVPAFG